MAAGAAGLGRRRGCEGHLAADQATGGGKAAALPAGCRHGRGGISGGGESGSHRADFTVAADAERGGVVCGLCLANVLAGGSGGALPESHGSVFILGSGRRIGAARPDQRHGVCVAQKAPRPAGGMALVCGDVGAGDRAGADFQLRPCGPIHLPAADRAVCRGGMGGGGLVPRMAVSALDSGRALGVRDFGVACQRPNPNRLLAEQRVALGPCARLHKAKLACPQQPWRCLGPEGPGRGSHRPISRSVADQPG